MQIRKYVTSIEPDMGQQTGSKLGKKYMKAVMSPCLFNLYAEYIMQNTRLDEAQAGIKIAGKISITSDIQMTPPYSRKLRGTKESLNESERKVKKLA